MKKILISLGLVMAVTSGVMAHSTIYTDDIGRMHFLGKDPGAMMRANQLENVQEQNKGLTDIIYKNQEAPKEETKVNATEHANKSKGSFTFNKGAMDASDPYTYGETNIAPKNEEQKNTEKKHFWDNW